MNWAEKKRSYIYNKKVTKAKVMGKKTLKYKNCKIYQLKKHTYFTMPGKKLSQY